MIDKLLEEINSFLAFYKITGLGIFRDWIIESAGIDVESAGRARFFYNYYDKSKLTFKVADYGDKEKLLHYFASVLEAHTNEETLQSWKNQQKRPDQIKLNQALLDSLLLFFKHDINEIYQHQPEKLKPYQHHSQNDITKAMKGQILEQVEKIKAKIAHYPLEMRKNYTSLTPLVKKLKAWEYVNCKLSISALSAIQNELKTWFEMSANPFLYSDWYALDQQITRFMSSNCLEEHIKTQEFLAKLDQYFLELGIDIGKCDAFEHILLRMIGIEQVPVCSQFMTSDFDPCDISISLTFTQEDDTLVDRILSFLKNNGDAHAYLFNKDKRDSDGNHIGYYIYKDGLEGGPEADRCYVPDPNPPVSYSLRLNGRVCADIILPQFIRYIEGLGNNKDLILQPYRDQSKNSTRIPQNKPLPQPMPFFKPAQPESNSANLASTSVAPQ